MRRGWTSGVDAVRVLAAFSVSPEYRSAKVKKSKGKRKGKHDGLQGMTNYEAFVLKSELTEYKHGPVPQKVDESDSLTRVTFRL